MDRLARSGLAVLVLGVSANLALAFAPGAIPAPAATVIAYCMAGVVVVLTPVWVYRELVVARRRMRGIDYVGDGRNRQAEYDTVWRGAKHHLLALGVGITTLSRDERLLRETVRRGVQVDVVMIDPDWLNSNPPIAAMLDDAYQHEGFSAQTKASLHRAQELAARLNKEVGKELVRVRTYQSWPAFSITIADCRSDQPVGFVEFHLYHHLRRVGLGITDYRSDDTRQSFLVDVLDSVDALVGEPLGYPAEA
ncbi:hypothetical protein [Promicromonospora sp. NPDC019610]|uniref:hypothetical protein n=1 Tax=Promicromonospora sp. NPDC019610 TaxID=3364405 RepID=UPI0037ACA65B